MTRRCALHGIGLVLLLALTTGRSRAEETATVPPLAEVLRLIEANLPAVDARTLNEAQVQGLLSRLHPRVVLVTNLAPFPGDAPRVSQSNVFDRAFGYLRVAEVGPGLSEQLATACQQLRATNRLQGLVLDLRFANGDDFAAAGAAADLFVKNERVLLSWGQTRVRATKKDDGIFLPIAVLMNQESSGAAEALAGALRESGVALLVGRPTAGHTYVFRDFNLTNGQRLRIAAEPLRLGEGKPLEGGLVPDIPVAVSGSDEKVYFADPYALIARTPRRPGAAAAAAPRPPQSEAELVRQRREEAEPDAEPAAPGRGEVLGPMVQDPDLARALDLLKGITIISRPR